MTYIYRWPLPYLECLFPHLFALIHVSSLKYEQCIYAKNHRIPFKINSNKNFIPFSCVYTDVWEPFFTPSALEHKYFVSFINDCTRVSWIYFMKSKRDVISFIPQFYQMILTQIYTLVQVFHFDNGHEFVNQSLTTFFHTDGILHQTCVYIPK